MVETIQEIDLGYMSVADGEWKSDRDDAEPLDPYEIIVPQQDITVIYDYPLSGKFEFKHHTDNPKGFTRAEISEQIMSQYHEIYDEDEDEDEEDCGPSCTTSHVNYGIWGHEILDLILHTLYVYNNGKYGIDLDS